MTVQLSASPEPLAFAPEQSAVIVNDMQNAFCSKGGYLDQIGFDVAPAEKVVDAVAHVLNVAREAKIAVFHGQNGINHDLSDVPVGSPWRIKSPAMRHMRSHPDQKKPLLTEGTWNFAIRDEVAPQPGEVVFRKSRPSCFAGTGLDHELRSRGISTIYVVGIASNVGVEWTLREGLSRDFFGIMIKDATMPAGTSEVQRTVIHNVENFVGWTTTVGEFSSACRDAASLAARR